MSETLASSRVQKLQVENKEKEMVVKPVVSKKRKRVWDTWLKRCYAIYMYMHPQIFNCNASEASEVLGTSRTTLLGWVTLSVKKNYVNRWFDIVANLTWADVKQNFNEEIADKYKHIPEESKVNLSKYKELRGENVVLSSFCGVPAAKRARLARKSANASARGEVSVAGVFTLVNKHCKKQIRDKYIKYPETAKHVTDYILQAWYSGSPVSRQGCYVEVFNFSSKGTKF